MSPQIGNRVLVFSMGQPLPDFGYVIFHVDVTRELVYESPEERIRVPEALRTLAERPQAFQRSSSPSAH